MNHFSLYCCMVLSTSLIGFGASPVSPMSGDVSLTYRDVAPWEDVLQRFPRGSQEWKAAHFLITNMPSRDFQGLPHDLLEKNIHLACKARKQYPWGKTIPDEIFFNDVLPYAIVDETRENWREPFLALFGPLVENCQTMTEAAKIVNASIPKLTGVDYNTRRKKPNQSPAESMKQHMASCTGLAILLVDAFRSVSIPARFVGTASWFDNRGNHSWVEVWIDGQWHITEYYLPPQFDKLWFMSSAGKASPDSREYAIYATSFRHTDDSFPMVWNPQSTDVPAINVTQRYIDLYQSMRQEADRNGTHIPLVVRTFQSGSTCKNSEDRIPVNIDVFHDQLQVDGGRSAGPLQDMNDVLTFYLGKNKTYTLRYQDTKGNPKETTIVVGNRPLSIDLLID